MYKKLFPPCVGLLCCFGAVSCDQVVSFVDNLTSEEVPSERRVGLGELHDATASDMRVWLAEPNVLVVLDFYSASCPPCQAMTPALEKMAVKYADKAAIMKVNVGVEGELATVAMNEYQINETPVLKFFLNGEEVAELRGGQSEDELNKVFKKYTERIDGEFTMREGSVPGMHGNRSVEEMMVRSKRGQLPSGMIRTKVPDEADEVTKGLPKKVHNAGAMVPDPTKPGSAATAVVAAAPAVVAPVKMKRAMPVKSAGSGQAVKSRIPTAPATPESPRTPISPATPGVGGR